MPDKPRGSKIIPAITLLIATAALVIALFGVLRSPKNVPGEPTAECVRTRSLQVVDESGTCRASISSRRDKGVGLSLMDENGQARMFLSVANDGKSGMALNDKQSHARVLLGVTEDGHPSLSVFDGDKEGIVATVKEGRTTLSLSNGPDCRIVLMAEERGPSQLFLYSNYPHSTVALRASGDASGLAVMDKDRQTRATFMVAADSPMLRFYDKDMKVRLSAMACDKDVAEILVANGEERPCVRINGNSDGRSELSVYDAQGKSVWTKDSKPN